MSALEKPPSEEGLEEKPPAIEKTRRISEIPLKRPEVVSVNKDRRSAELRQEIIKNSESDAEKKDTIDVLKSLRLRRVGDRIPVPLGKGDKKLLENMAHDGARKLEDNHEPGFGVFPSAKPDENFYEQLWTRDFAHAAGNYFATQCPKALKDSLETVFSYQREERRIYFT